jgi:uroporphyrinogen decarboxylase
VKKIKEELKGKVPLIGFSAAPWTLMYYMVGGSSKSNTDNGMIWLREYPEASAKLLDILTNTVIEYTSAQIDAGADLIQIFEAMGNFIDKDLFEEWALPYMNKITKELKLRYPHIPLLIFPRGATYSNDALQQMGYDVVTLDTNSDRVLSRKILEGIAAIKTPVLGRVSSIQGNFPVTLLNKETSSPIQVKNAVRKMLKELGPQKLIANLGEGLSGSEDPELVTIFVESIHSISEEMIKDEKLRNYSNRMRVSI